MTGGGLVATKTRCIIALAACALFAGACSYMPKTDNSIDASGSEVKSTATIKTNTIQRPLE